MLIMKDYYISHYRLNQPFCLCMHNSFMSLSGGHLNGVLVKSPGSVYIEGIATTHTQQNSTQKLDKQIHDTRSQYTGVKQRDIHPHKHKQDRNLEHIEKPWDHRRNTSTYWNTIHGLAHKRPPHQDNNSITFKDNTHINPKDIASAFNKQFTNTIPHKTNTTHRKIIRKVLSLQSTQINITTEQAIAAIKTARTTTQQDLTTSTSSTSKTLARTEYSTTLQSTATRYLVFGNWPTSYRPLNLQKTSTLGRHTGRYPFYLLSQRHSRM